MPRLLSHAPNEMVGHDLGTMVAYAYAARYPDTTEQLVVMDAPVPGIPPWDDLVRHPLLWHFSFGGPDAERLVAGRERIYLDRFRNEFAGNPAKIDEPTRVHYATLYARPGAIRFHLAAHVHTDIVSHSVDAFPTRTAEEFLDFLNALLSTNPAGPHPTALEQFLGAHPQALAFIHRSPLHLASDTSNPLRPMHPCCPAP